MPGQTGEPKVLFPAGPSLHYNHTSKYPESIWSREPSLYPSPTISCFWPIYLLEVKLHLEHEGKRWKGGKSDPLEVSYLQNQNRAKQIVDVERTTAAWLGKRYLVIGWAVKGDPIDTLISCFLWSWVLGTYMPIILGKACFCDMIAVVSTWPLEMPCKKVSDA